MYVSLHTADPGTDGQTANEATGGGYVASGPTSSATWNAGTSANPNVITNAAVITFPTATGAGYNSGTTAMTFFGLWRTTGRTAADFIGRGSITSQLIVTGNVPSFAIGALSTTINET